MSYQPSHHTAATRHQPPMDAADLDAFMIDEEFDDYLDRQIAAFRDSLADFRNA